MSPNLFCPCHSGKFYRECCEPYHQGVLPESALLLMRSRYAAYARHLTGYIIETTHRDNPAYMEDKAQWKQNILAFYKGTRFLGLTIHAFLDGAAEAYVVFTAHLEQNGRDISFSEKSRFCKENGRWLYLSGEKFN